MTTGFEIFFIFIAVITLVTALMVVTTSNLVHAAFWLILTLLGVAVTFVLLNAAFLAVVQVVIYIGAIAILMIFAIMLTRNIMRDSGPQLNSNWILAAIIGVGLFAGLSILLLSDGIADKSLPELTANVDQINELGIALVSPSGYVIPFEIASVLLLSALIGAIYSARKE